MHSPRHWDARLHAYVGGLPASAADRWLRRLSSWADHGKLWFAVGALLALRRGALRRGAARGLGSMALSSALVNLVLKRLFNRLRPELGDLHPDRLLSRAHATPSFPSGHSSSAAAFVTGVALETATAGAALAPLALGVGYSRVHGGVHYPADVLAGLAVGATVAASSRRWWPAGSTDRVESHAGTRTRVGRTRWRG